MGGRWPGEGVKSQSLAPAPHFPLGAHFALRFGRDGGRVSVVQDRDGDRFELVVADDDPGLARQRIASLAEATFHLDPARPRGGGLGLATAQEAARRFGWFISFETVDPSGLRVRVKGLCGS